MNQQPDKFFRDKLEPYRPAVSESAWQRVSENIDRKNRRRLFLRVAASLLLLAAGTLLIYPSVRNGQPDVVADNRPADVTTNREHHEPTPDQPEPVELQKRTPPPVTPGPGQLAEKAPVSRKTEKKKEVVTSPHDPDPTTAISAVEDRMITQSTVNESVSADSETSVPTASPSGSNHIVIVLTADEVNKKYLTINSEAEATPDDDQASGLRKLLGKAQDLKHNQDLLGSLRQKKNQILAMNFRGEREITQND